MSTATNPQQLPPSDRLKQAAADAAAAQLENGSIVGLGSGSTASLAVSSIGRRVAQGLRITGIPTSEKTAGQARQLNIPLTTLGEYPLIDVTIDGADEVERGTLNLIKGGGGNLLREKIVASASKRLVIVVDQSKLVPQLGTHFKVPVEVAQFGWQSTAHRLEALKGNPVLRRGQDEQPYITDGGNYILDCAFGPIASASELAGELDSVVGVVEHGLFIGLTSHVFIGTPDGVNQLNP
jgi:ribose 5-phosphate isomerase A